MSRIKRYKSGIHWVSAGNKGTDEYHSLPVLMPKAEIFELVGKWEARE